MYWRSSGPNRSSVNRRCPTTGKLRRIACFLCVRSCAATAPTTAAAPVTTRVHFMGSSSGRRTIRRRSPAERPGARLPLGLPFGHGPPPDESRSRRSRSRGRGMKLVPRPDQVVSAAGNVAHKVLYGGLADLRPVPRTLIDEGELREVYHYRPRTSAREHGDPVLLVTPLAAPALCFDLRRGCSLVEHFVEGGRPTYLVEYWQVAFKDRNLGMEHWVDEVVPRAITEVSKHAGDRPVHVIGWSLGAIFALLPAPAGPALPFAPVPGVGPPTAVRRFRLGPPTGPFRGRAGE